MSTIFHKVGTAGLFSYSVGADGLSWDWINQKLYWTDECNNKIEVFDPLTGDRKTLLETGPGSNPRGIVVDPTTR